jgi:hypothetical protein
MARRSMMLLAALAVVPAVAAAQAAPTQQQLGVPLYPGATFQASMSEGLSQPTEKYYVFTTGDPLARVVAFYENATKLTAQDFGEQGAKIIAIKGNPPFPQHGIVIEPNRAGMYPATVTTVFTVRRELPSEETPPDTSGAGR